MEGRMNLRQQLPQKWTVPVGKNESVATVATKMTFSLLLSLHRVL
jgi:hypothetical protein